MSSNVACIVRENASSVQIVLSQDKPSSDVSSFGALQPAQTYRDVALSELAAAFVMLYASAGTIHTSLQGGAEHSIHKNTFAETYKVQKAIVDLCSKPERLTSVLPETVRIQGVSLICLIGGCVRFLDMTGLCTTQIMEWLGEGIQKLLTRGTCTARR